MCDLSALYSLVAFLLNNLFLYKSFGYAFAGVLLAVLLYVSSGTVQAGQVSNLYSASVPISSQQPSDRSIGFEEAFVQVLTKVSGDAGRIERVASEGVLSSSEPYVQTFSYRENPEYKTYLEVLARQQEAMVEEKAGDVSNQNAEDSGALGERVGDDDTENSSEIVSLDEQILALEKKLAAMQNGTYVEQDKAGIPDQKDPEELLAPMPFLLDVSFAESAINRELTNLNIPVWGTTRPSTLLWTVIEQEGERRLLGDDEFTARQHLEELAAQRGVQIFLPVADLTDVSSVDLNEVWALFPDSISRASQRYDADANVMMRLYQNADDNWEADWNIQHRDMLQSGTLAAESVEQVVDELVDHVARMLSSRYAVLRTEDEQSSGFQIVVSDIDSYKDYILVQRYLETLPPVAEMKLDWVSSNQHGYTLLLNGSPEQFFEHIELGKKLTRTKTSAAELRSEESLTENRIGVNDLSPALASYYQKFEQQLEAPKTQLVWLGSNK